MGWPSKLRGRRATPGPGPRSARAANDESNDGRSRSRRSPDSSDSSLSPGTPSTAGRRERQHKPRRTTMRDASQEMPVVAPTQSGGTESVTEQRQGPVESDERDGHDQEHEEEFDGPRPPRSWSPTPHHSPQRGRVFGPLSSLSLQIAKSGTVEPEKLRSSLKKAVTAPASSASPSPAAESGPAGPADRHFELPPAHSTRARRIRFVLTTTDKDAAEEAQLTPPTSTPTRRARPGLREGCGGDAGGRVRRASLPNAASAQCRQEELGGLLGDGEAQAHLLADKDKGEEVADGPDGVDLVELTRRCALASPLASPRGRTSTAHFRRQDNHKYN